MQPPPPTTDLLALRARPELAAALRARLERIVQRWTAAVEEHLPDADPDPNGWRIFVSDRGPGIAPELVAKLFDSFRRGETHGQAGMGLGLTIASHAARLLGSELTVESKLGEGSIFSFSLPSARPEQAA